MTTNKQRLAQLEKQTDKNKSDSPLKSWKAFIEWCNGKLKFDLDTETRLQKEWTEFVEKPGGDE